MSKSDNWEYNHLERARREIRGDEPKPSTRFSIVGYITDTEPLGPIVGAILLALAIGVILFAHFR